MLAPAGQTPSCQTKVTLIESDSRKAAFLRHVARTVGVPVDIFAERAELAATRASLHNADVVSARALAPLVRLLDWVEPFAGPGSTIVLPKGKDLNKELQDIEKTWQSDSLEVPSLTDPQGRILVMTNLRRRQSS
jgi:16S rRNA (guanine527-N7)-methyltransferase